jgi:hypothetical protein
VITAWEVSLGQTFLTLLYFFLFFLWIWLFITIFADVIRSDDLSGWGKAGWSALIIFLPYLGVFVYLIARGHSMNERAGREARRREDAMQAYVRDVAATPSPAEEIERLSALQSRGDITEAEFQQAKTKILA